MARARTMVRASPRSPAPPVTGALSTGAFGGSGNPRSLYWNGGSDWPIAGDAVSPQSIGGIPAAQRCLNLIAGTVCQLPLIDRRPDGSSWGPRPVLDDPWPMMGVAEWLTYQVHALMMLGDAMAIPVDYDDENVPRQLVPIDPRVVTVRVDDQTNRVVYDVVLADGVLTLGRADIWHAKGLFLTSDGLRGVSTVYNARVAWQNALAIQRYGNNVYGQGVPSGIVKVHLREVSEDQVTSVKSQWLGAFQDRVPAVLSELMDFTPIAWSPEDAQYLEAARLSVAYIAMLFNLDPTDLDATLGTSMTYANREQRAYDRLLSSIGPYLIRIEQAYRFILPRQHEARFDRSAVLWSDASTRAYVETAELANGTATLNEIRVRNGRPPYGDWANQPFANPTAAPIASPPMPGGTLNA